MDEMFFFSSSRFETTAPFFNPTTFTEDARFGHPYYFRSWETTQKKFRKKKLSGAKKKRIRWFIEQGKSYNEALELVSQPSFSGSNGNQQSYVSRSLNVEIERPLERSSGFPTRISSETSAASSVKLSFLSASSATAAQPTSAVTPTQLSPQPRTGCSDLIKLCIYHKDYPRILLTNGQLKKLLSSVLEFVVTQNTVYPGFRGFTLGKGFIQITCVNVKTAEWLKNLEGKLMINEKADIKIVDDFNMPKFFTANGVFQKCNEDADDFILKLISSQNQGLNTKKWKILERIQEGSVTKTVLTIDSASAHWLMEKGPMINFKFSSAQIHINGEEKKPQDFKDVEDKKT